MTPCVACHPAEAEGGRGLRFRIEGFEACRSCHTEEDPHEGAFGEAPCETCHETTSFLMETFDHEREALRPWIRECSLCHEKTQPHGDQFPGRQCGECHGTDTYEILAFDHSGSRFPLDGAHQAVPCDACHREEVDVEREIGLMVRYRPLDLACVACHGGGP